MVWSGVRTQGVGALLTCALCACWLMSVDAVYSGRRSDNSLAGGGGGGGGGCTRPLLEHGRVRGRQRARLVRFICLPGYELVGNKYATCAAGEWDVPLPVCVRPGCPTLPMIEHGIRLSSHHGAYNVFFCGPGHQLTGSSVLYCDGVEWNSTAPVCVDTSKPAALSCDFESSDWCGWRNDEFHDFDWRRFSKKTPSAFMNTGPSHDHTLGPGGAGHYLYVESTGKQENEQARLLSPIYEAAVARGGCFSMHYHMFGKTTGKLRVYQKPISLDLPRMLSAGVGSSQYRLWERSGNQGDHWYRAVVDLHDFSEDFQIVIEGVRGSSFTSDIAVDDVDVIVSGEQCRRAKLTVTPVVLPTASAALDSCAGRCFSERLFTDVGDMFECSCEESCLGENACCADFRDICELPDSSSMDSSESTSAETSTTPREFVPQTMKLVATSSAHALPDTTTTTTQQPDTTVTTPQPTTTTIRSIIIRATTTPRQPTTTRTTSTTKFSTLKTLRPNSKSSTLKTMTVRPPTSRTTITTTAKPTTAKRLIFTTKLSTFITIPSTLTTTPSILITKPSTVTTKRQPIMTTVSPKTNIIKIPQLIFKTATTGPYNATGLLKMGVTPVKESPKVQAKKTTVTVKIVTLSSTTPDSWQPISRTFENHNTYHQLVKAQKEKQKTENGGEVGGGVVWACAGAALVVAAIVAAGTAARRAARRRRGCADEVRYLTRDDRLDLDSPAS